jgi:hypothetical protein
MCEAMTRRGGRSPGSLLKRARRRGVLLFLPCKPPLELFACTYRRPVTLRTSAIAVAVAVAAAAAIFIDNADKFLTCKYKKCMVGIPASACSALRIVGET